jgi:hypothetical protein
MLASSEYADNPPLVARGGRHRSAAASTTHADTLSDDDERLAPLADRAEVRRRSPDGRDRHLIAQDLDLRELLNRLQVLFFHGASRREVFAAASLQGVHVIGKGPAVPSELDCAQRRELIHDGDEIGRPEGVEHDARQRFATTIRGRERLDVVLVPEDQERAHVVARRFGGSVLLAADRQRPIVDRLPVGRDELERGDGLDPAVLAHLEIIGSE